MRVYRKTERVDSGAPLGVFFRWEDRAFCVLASGEQPGRRRRRRPDGVARYSYTQVECGCCRVGRGCRRGHEPGSPCCRLGHGPGGRVVPVEMGIPGTILLDRVVPVVMGIPGAIVPDRVVTRAYSCKISRRGGRRRLGLVPISEYVVVMCEAERARKATAGRWYVR